MTLARTRTAHGIVVAQATAHQIDSFLQSCLAQYLSVTFYAEMEERIAEIITARLQTFTNTPIGKFLASNQDKIIRRTQKSDIVQLIESFGPEFKTAFNNRISIQDVSFYSNVINARHGVGHRQGSNITLADINAGLDAADKILNAINQCFDDAP